MIAHVGSLVVNEDKHAASDFVVWKKTKDHTDDGIVEPSWESPWGPGTLLTSTSYDIYSIQYYSTRDGFHTVMLRMSFTTKELYVPICRIVHTYTALYTYTPQ